jgi:hypothetical protein
MDHRNDNRAPEPRRFEQAPQARCGAEPTDAELQMRHEGDLVQHARAHHAPRRTRRGALVLLALGTVGAIVIGVRSEAQAVPAAASPVRQGSRAVGTATPRAPRPPARPRREVRPSPPAGEDDLSGLLEERDPVSETGLEGGRAAARRR